MGECFQNNGSLLHRILYFEIGGLRVSPVVKVHILGRGGGNQKTKTEAIYQKWEKISNFESTNQKYKHLIKIHFFLFDQSYYLFIYFIFYLDIYLPVFIQYLFILLTGNIYFIIYLPLFMQYLFILLNLFIIFIFNFQFIQRVHSRFNFLLGIADRINNFFFF